MTPAARAARAAAAIALSIAAAAPAHAIFGGGDDEARRAILDLRGRFELQQREAREQTQRLAEANRRIDDILARLERVEQAGRGQLEQTGRGQLELQNQLQALREELARVRGQLEVQTNELAQTQRRQRDLADALDARLRSVEPVQVSVDGKPVVVDRAEQRSFDAALAQLRANDFRNAVAAFQAFLLQYPQSAYAPGALYWIGTSQFQLKDWKAAIAGLGDFVARHPEHPRVPEAMLNLGFAQIEAGDRRTARRTLETLVARHPESGAAGLARERLATLK